MSEKRNFIFILSPACNIVRARSGESNLSDRSQAGWFGSRACNLRDRPLYRCNGATFNQQGALWHFNGASGKRPQEGQSVEGLIEKYRHYAVENRFSFKHHDF